MAINTDIIELKRKSKGMLSSASKFANIDKIENS